MSASLTPLRQVVIPPPAGTILVFADIACPWGSLAVHRLRARRSALGLDADVTIDHRAFPLELINRRATPKQVLDAEVAVIADHAPELDWKPWSLPDWTYPGSVLVALEAVQAAKEPRVGGMRISENLDAALRNAFFSQGRPIGLHSTVLDVAKEVDELNASALGVLLESGAARSLVFDQWRQAVRHNVQGSPHLFMPDGSSLHNPGIELHWTDGEQARLPVIDADDPSVFDDLLVRTASP